MAFVPQPDPATPQQITTRDILAFLAGLGVGVAGALILGKKGEDVDVVVVQGQQQ